MEDVVLTAGREYCIMRNIKSSRLSLHQITLQQRNEEIKKVADVTSTKLTKLTRNLSIISALKL